MGKNGLYIKYKSFFGFSPFAGRRSKAIRQPEPFVYSDTGSSIFSGHTVIMIVKKCKAASGTK